MILESDTTPFFNWSAENNMNNVIYFSVVSSLSDAIITATYTTEKTWQFYDTSNVVLNLTEQTSPTLNNNTQYNYLMLGVSEDNWVHTSISANFFTN